MPRWLLFVISGWLCAHLVREYDAMSPRQPLLVPPKHRSRMGQWREARGDDALAGAHENTRQIGSVAQRRSALLSAAGLGAFDDVEALLFSGTQVADRERDLRGRKALHHAAVNGHAAVARLLLRYGAAADEPDNDGRTPLILCALGGHEEALRVLLDAGARVGAADNFGNTALHYAASESYKYGFVPSSGHAWPLVPTDGIRRSKVPMDYRVSEREAKSLVVCEALLAAGADLDAKNHVGSTPLTQSDATARYENGYSDVLEAEPFVQEYQKDGVDTRERLDELGRNVGHLAQQP